MWTTGDGPIVRAKSAPLGVQCVFEFRFKHVKPTQLCGPRAKKRPTSADAVGGAAIPETGTLSRAARSPS